MAQERIYKGILLKDTDKNVRMSHSRSLNAISQGNLEKDVNNDYIDMLLDVQKQLLKEEEFYALSALNSIINLNYQVCNGGIYQYFFNGYHTYSKPYNDNDVAQLDKDDQVEMLKELLDFAKEVYPEKEDENNILKQVITMFAAIEYKENVPIYGFVESEEDEFIYEEEEEKQNPDWFEPYEDIIDHEDLITMHNDEYDHSAEFDSLYYKVNPYLETLMETYAQYLYKTFDCTKEIDITNHESNHYQNVKIGVFQLRSGQENYVRKFANLKTLEKYGEKPESKNYELIYVGTTAFVRAFPEEWLEQFYMKLNDGSPHPENYYGYSLSVGDVVVLSKGNEYPSNEEAGDCYYVDSVGFKKIDDFFDKNDIDHAKEKFYRNIDVKEEMDLMNEISALDKGNNKEMYGLDWLLNPSYRASRSTQLTAYNGAISLAKQRGAYLEEKINNIKDIKVIPSMSKEDDGPER